MRHPWLGKDATTGCSSAETGWSRSRIRTGTVEINGAGVGFHAPIGGFKKSGIGREAGLEGFDAYVEIKSIGLPKDLAE